MSEESNSNFNSQGSNHDEFLQYLLRAEGSQGHASYSKLEAELLDAASEDGNPLASDPTVAAETFKNDAISGPASRISCIDDLDLTNPIRSPHEVSIAPEGDNLALCSPTLYHANLADDLSRNHDEGEKQVQKSSANKYKENDDKNNNDREKAEPLALPKPSARPLKRPVRYAAQRNEPLEHQPTHISIKRRKTGAHDEDELRESANENEDEDDDDYDRNSNLRHSRKASPRAQQTKRTKVEKFASDEPHGDSSDADNFFGKRPSSSPVAAIAAAAAAAAAAERENNLLMYEKSGSFSRNAIAARENRERKKFYLHHLENAVEDLSSKLQTTEASLQTMRDENLSLRTEVEYLKNVIANQSTLSSLLVNIQSAPGVAFAGSRHALTRSVVSQQMTNDVKQQEQQQSSMKSKRRSKDPLDINAPQQMSKKTTLDGGICLHVSERGVSLELCTKCAGH